jgi:hypothetical protein
MFLEEGYKAMFLKRAVAGRILLDCRVEYWPCRQTTWKRGLDTTVSGSQANSCFQRRI